LTPHFQLRLAQDEQSKVSMNQERILEDRADIERRVTEFKETQAKFQREREDYFDATIEKARNVEWNVFASPRH
jgi:hypothetical protein